ncbi:MAG: S-layer homology domain-containing protein [Thermomicrobiales bacterium]
MAALIARAMGWSAEDWGNPFTDQNGMDANLWRNVRTLAHYGVAFGYGDGTFGPNDKVTYAQTISFISRAMVVKGYWQKHTAPPDPVPHGGILQHRAPERRGDVPLLYGELRRHTRSSARRWLRRLDTPSSRAWFCRTLWNALRSHYSDAVIP